MKHLIAIALAAAVSVASAQEPQLSPDAPPDKPFSVDSGGAKALDAAIAPHIAQARRTYPAAREKFIAGLPEGQSFFVTTRLRDGSGAFEQVFIAVREIDGGIIHGRVWSEINRVRGFKFGDPYQFPEAELIDWLITYPDGSEEGNFVGKFLDSYGGDGG